MSSPAWLEDDYELRNDDGFVYKRRKRLRLPEEEEHQLSTPSEPAVVDLEAQLKKRKTRTLAKLKDRYQKELVQWELLSNSLRELDERAQQHQQPQQSQQDPFLRDSTEPLLSNQLSEPGFEAQLDELLSQVEAQEAMIQSVSMICDAAEAICNAEEERLKKPFFDLPVWVTPQSIFACLCEEDNCNNNADDT